MKEGLPFAQDLSLENTDCDTHSPALLDLFLYFDTSVCSTVAFLPLENSDYVNVLVSVDFQSNSKRDGSFHSKACDYSHVS